MLLTSNFSITKSTIWLICLVTLALVTLSIAAASRFTIPENVLISAEADYGSEAKDRLLAWQDLINQNRGVPELVKLKVVNRFFNKIKYVPDEDQWGQRTFWATPAQFLARNGGDAEDYALAKYFTLRELGVPASKLRLTFVKSVKLNQAHMVLTYYETPSAEPLILDNLRSLILFATERQDLQPVYSFNGDGLWKTGTMASRSRDQRVGNSGGNKMKLWIDLRQRMAAEGFDMRN